MVNFLQQTIKQPENLYSWMQEMVERKPASLSVEAQAVGLSIVEIPIEQVVDKWTAIYNWCCEHGVPQQDFQMYWHERILTGFFKSVQLALMYKLRWG